MLLKPLGAVILPSLRAMPRIRSVSRREAALGISLLLALALLPITALLGFSCMRDNYALNDLRAPIAAPPLHQ